MFAHAGGRANAIGDAQTGRYILRRYVANTVAPTVLTTDGAAPGTTNQIVLPNNSVYIFDGNVVGRDGGDSSSWRFRGTIERGANAAATAIIGSVTIDAPVQEAGASTWTLAVDADTTNGCLRITVTGELSVNIIFASTVMTTEVIN
jgi:hypothetical protein